MKKQFLTTGLILLSVTAPLKATATDYSQIYVFGDSLSDVGNSFDVTGVPPSPPYYQGRFSNGPIWVDYLTQDLGLAANGQTNFAFGGATTGSNNTLIPGVQGLPGLQQQIEGFKAANTQADPNALYIVWAGANDYLGAGVTNPQIPVSNLTTAVSTLANSGAKDIMVVNLPDLGTLPGSSGNREISAQLNTVASLHNAGLKASLEALSATSNTNIIPLDVNSLFNRAIATPAEFGFTNVTDSCLSASGICSNPNEYLFWDEIHPTTTGHKLVGELAVAAIASQPVPEPTAGLGVLALGGLGVISVLKRQKRN